MLSDVLAKLKGRGALQFTWNKFSPNILYMPVDERSLGAEITFDPDEVISVSLKRSLKSPHCHPETEGSRKFRNITACNQTLSTSSILFGT